MSGRWGTGYPFEPISRDILWAIVRVTPLHAEPAIAGPLRWILPQRIVRKRVVPLNR